MICYVKRITCILGKSRKKYALGFQDIEVLALVNIVNRYAPGRRSKIWRLSGTPSWKTATVPCPRADVRFLNVSATRSRIYLFIRRHFQNKPARCVVIPSAYTHNSLPSSVTSATRNIITYVYTGCPAARVSVGQQLLFFLLLIDRVFRKLFDVLYIFKQYKYLLEIMLAWNNNIYVSLFFICVFFF